MRYPWPPNKESRIKIINEYLKSSNLEEPCPYGQLCYYPMTKTWGGWDSTDVRNKYASYDREAKEIEDSY